MVSFVPDSSGLICLHHWCSVSLLDRRGIWGPVEGGDSVPSHTDLRGSSGWLVIATIGVVMPGVRLLCGPSCVL